MEKLRDEDFRIIDDHTEIRRKPTKQDILRKIINGEKAYYDMKICARRKNIRAGKDAMDGILVEPKVRQLFELDEINYSDAIRLDYFASLSQLERNIYFDAWCLTYDDNTHHYCQVNSQLAIALTDYGTLGVMARYSLQNAQNLCVSQSEADNMRPNKLHQKRIDNYNTFINSNRECLDDMDMILMGRFGGKPLGIYKADSLRKQTAKDVVNTAKRLDFYSLFMDSGSNLFFYNAIRNLRACGVSREVIARVPECGKIRNRLHEDLVKESRSDRKASDLIILSDKESRYISQERI